MFSKAISGDKNRLSWMALALAPLLPYLVFLAFWHYGSPGADETHQLQAAIQLFRGHGYLSSLYALPKDLATGGYIQLDSWPVGYSACLVALMHLGFSVGSAAALFQIAMVLLGMAAWSLASAGLAPFARVTFLALVATNFLVWGNYSTTAFTWAGTGWLTYLSIAWASRKSGTSGADFRFAMFCSLLLGMMVLQRYQSATFVISVFFFYLFHRFGKGRWAALLGNLFVIGILGTAAMAGILWFNTHHGDNATFLTRTKVSGSWSPRSFSEMASTFFFGATFRLNERLGSLGEVFALALTVFSGLFFWRAYQAEATRAATRWFLFLLVPHILVMQLLALRFGIDLQYGKYAHFIVPPFLLAVFHSVAAFPRLQKKMQHPFLAAATMVAALLAASFFSLHRERLNFAVETKASRAATQIESLRARFPRHALFVISDSVFPAFVMKGWENLDLFTEAALQSEAHASRPTLVVMVHDRAPPKAMYPPLARIGDMVSRYRMQRKELGDLDFYWGEALPAAEGPSLK